MSCADVQTIQAGDGTKSEFSFDFPYLFKSEVKVYFWNRVTKEYDEIAQDGSGWGQAPANTIYPWEISDANPTIVHFTEIDSGGNTAAVPPSPAAAVDPNEETVDNVKIRRETSIDDIRALFNPGSAIRSDDLNKNFEQLRYAIQEGNCQGITDDVYEYLKDNYWDRYDNTLYEDDAWVSDDTKIATTAALDKRFQDEVAETITSSESWPDNDDTIATTAAIDNRIDTAITNDIGTDGTGITVTDDGDGTITLGLGSGSIDLDRIKAEDIITQAEQNADFDLAGDDDSVFTSSAAIRRFENYVQNNAPSGTGIGTGRMWLDVEDDLTLSVWNGSAWTAISSGGTFSEQPNVVYVDASSGSNDNDGHRISRPKLTIKAAIEQINSEIEIDVTATGFNGGSGYVDATYSNVSLTHSSGTGIGTGLTATVTVSGGAVTAITLSTAQQTTLEEYSIGDVLTASNADLGGSGSGLLIPITGNGDGQIVVVAAGTYQEVAPLQIKRRNVSVIGQALRSCIVHPTSATELNTLFELNSGSYIANLTLTGMQAGTGTGNTLDAVLPTDQGWNFAFYNNAFITKSPYIQNCTNFSDSEIDNDDLRSHRPRGGTAGDTDSDPTGGGLLVNGATPHADSPLRSMVCDSYTHVGLNGPGILVTNNGYAQCTSSYAFFNRYHIKALNGGQANLAASTTDFGAQALVADGRSTTNIFTADCVTQANVNDTTIRVSNGVADASWHGTSTRPATNMLLSVNSDAQIYPITNVVPQDQATFDADPAGYTGDWIVTISRPNPDNRSDNQGFSAQVNTGTNNVQFWLRSMIASSGHTMEYVGSGTNYTALPENGGVPDETQQIVESNNGKVWTAITDHNGKFKIGGNQTDDPIFEVDQQLGFVTIPEGSIAFNLLSDQTPQLGGDLDVNGNEITSASNGNVVINPNGTGNIVVGAEIVSQDTNQNIELTPNGTGKVITSKIQSATAGDVNLSLDTSGTGNIDVNSNRITSLSDPTLAQDAATKAYVDAEVGAIGTISTLNTSVVTSDTGTDGTITFTTDGTTAMTIDNNQRLGVGTTSPATTLHLGNSGVLRINNQNGTRNLELFNNSSNAEIKASTDPIRINAEHSSGYVRFDTNNTERARIDSSGRVGIGTSSPSEVLDLRSTGTTRIFFESNDGGSPEYRATVGVDSGGFKIQTRDGTYGSNTDRLTIDTSGRVGIGTTSPGSLLQLTGSGVGANYLVINASSSGSETLEVGVPSGGGNVQLTATHSGGGSNSAGFIFRTRAGSSGTAERVRIDSSGRLLVGTSSSRSVDNEKILQIEGVNQQSSSMSLTRNTNSSAPPNISFGKSRGSTLGSNTIVQSGDSLGVIVFCGADGSDTNSIAAAITGQVDGTPGSNDMPGRLVFSTTANGASSPTERGKFDSDGYIYCYQSYTGTTAIAANLVVLSNGAFLRSSSSAKYKTQIEDLQNQYADALLDCRPVWYRSTCAADNPKHGYWGFIAEEVAEIDPRLVHWKTTEITYDEKGSAVETPCDPEPEGVAYDRFVPHLLNLIKRQKEQIEALEARLTAAGI